MLMALDQQKKRSGLNLIRTKFVGLGSKEPKEKRKKKNYID